MLKLVIVDDERLDREGLKRQLDWKEYNIGEVYTAQNGVAALELILEHHPDILLTDVKMPGMTGLALAEKAKKVVPDLKVIFVSGYDDFTFVKNAIKLNAYEYILKPVDTDELSVSIQKVVEDIDKELKVKKERDDLTNIMNKSKHLLKREFLLDLVFGTIDKSNVWEKVRSLELNMKTGSQAVLLVEIDDFKLIREKKQSKDLESDYSKLTEIIHSAGSGLCSVESVQVEEHRFASIISFENSSDDNVLVLEEIGEYFIKEAGIKTGLSITVASGCLVENPSDLYVSYNESMEAIMKKIFEGKGKVLTVDKDPTATDTETETTLETIDKELLKCLYNYDTVRMNHLLDYMFSKFESKRINDERYIQDHCINIISRFQIALHDMSIKIEDIFGHGVILWDKLMKFDTILDIRQWMKNVLGVIIEYAKEKNEARNNSIVNEVISYVEKHYAENISLKEIAERLYYSPNYLGSLFKREVGQGFSEYLTEFRIKKALELLKDYKLKIYEVAYMVGYKDIPTFIKNIKAVLGVTPTEFRERFSK